MVVCFLSVLGIFSLGSVSLCDSTPLFPVFAYTFASCFVPLYPFCSFRISLVCDAAAVLAYHTTDCWIFFSFLIGKFREGVFILCLFFFADSFVVPPKDALVSSEAACFRFPSLTLHS